MTPGEKAPARWVSERGKTRLPGCRVRGCCCDKWQLREENTDAPEKPDLHADVGPTQDTPRGEGVAAAQEEGGHLWLMK